MNMHPLQLVYQTPMQLKMLTSLREVYGKMDAEGRELTNAWDAVQTNVSTHMFCTRCMIFAV